MARPAALRRFALGIAMLTAVVATTTAHPGGASAAVDPPRWPAPKTQMKPVFPKLGTPGYTEWQGAVSNARSYMRVAGVDLRPGGTVTLTYDYEYHGLYEGYLCGTSCTVPFGKPHPPEVMPKQWYSSLYLGKSSNSQDYGVHGPEDRYGVAGAWSYKIGPSQGTVTEEVAQVVRPTNEWYSDAWYTIVRRATLTFTLPQQFALGDYTLGLDNHPSGTMSHSGTVLGTPYAEIGLSERAAWWTAGTLAPLLATGVSATVSTPDVKVVRFLQVSAKGCLKEVVKVTGASDAGTSKAAAACGFLTYSSNKNPPKSMEGKRWESFVSSKEFRAFTHVAPASVSCRGGLVVATPTTRPGSGTSPGWTPLKRIAGKYHMKAEPFADRRYRTNQPVVRLSEDRTAATIQLSQASRLALSERAGQKVLLGYDAPFIWTVVKLEFRCGGRGSFRISTSVSSVPRAAVYVADKQVRTTAQSPNLADFIRSGGKKLQKPGNGYFFAECQTGTVKQEGVAKFPAFPRCSPPITAKPPPADR